MSAAIAGWALEAVAGSALLMLLVLALREPVRAAFGAQVAYLLWLMPLARLLLPPSLLPSMWPEATAPLSRTGAAIVSVEVLPAGAGGAGPGVLPWLFAAWAAGVLALLAWQAIAYLRLRRATMRHASEVSRRGRVRVLRSHGDAGPFALGTLDPVIVLPRDFERRFIADERALVLAHEHAHHARGDLHANLVALGVLALHWFNPVAWIALRAFRADQELACDARVLAGDPSLRHAYGSALVKAARGGALSPACHLTTVDALKRRLKMLNVKAKSRMRRILGAGLASALALTGLVVTATGTPAGAAIERARAEVATVLQADDDVPPPPPAPAAPPLAPPEPPAAPAFAPPAPPAPPATIARTRTITRNGSSYRVLENGIEMPNISSRECTASDGDGRQHTIERGSGRSRHIVICTNRIERDVAAATAQAGAARHSAHQAMASALASLEASRGTLAHSPGMTAEQRAEALEGIDEAIVELREEMADPS